MRLKRDEASFLAVLEAHKGIVYKVANTYCRDEEGRRDLIQETTLQLWRAFPGYDERYKLSTWIYRIALNTAISFYRKEMRSPLAPASAMAPVLELVDDATEVEPNDDVATLQRFIGELREMDRALILLYLDGHSQTEIAEVLGLSVTNVSTKVGRIKEQLKKKFSRIKD